MELISASVFWACAVLVVYTYALYPLLLFFAYSCSQAKRDLRYLGRRCDRRARSLALDELPGVSVIIPAYNEGARLASKIDNLQRLNYPRKKLEVIFVSDGSTDGTNAFLQSHNDPMIKTVILPVRRGKANALNHGVGVATHEILVFSDASTLMDPEAVRKLLRHFSDGTVGVVCGALEFERSVESRETEGVYWKYESMLRLMEARLGVTLTASGAIYAVRRKCYRPLPVQTIIDDLIIPMTARKLGYRVLYDPEALAIDFAAASVGGEFTRRVRIAIGSFQALPQLLRLPMPGFCSIAFLSHKVLRWFLPFLFIGLLVSNALLLNSPIFVLAFVGQLVFYSWALAGALLRRRIQHVRYALVAYFVLAMQAAFLVGFLRSLRGSQEVTWQRVD